MNDAITFESLKDNEEFKAELATLNTAEEVAALFCRYGFEVTAEQVLEVVKSHNSGKNEMSEDDLEDVNGGAFLLGAAIIAGGIWLGIGAICGFLDGSNCNRKK